MTSITRIVSTVTVMLMALGNHAFVAADAGSTFYVATIGSDTNPGTEAQPVATLAVAGELARKAGAGSHRIIVMPGEYFAANTLELDARDNELTIEAEEVGKATIYGGRLVTGWRRDGGHFWSADLPGVKEGSWDFRALVVNGRMPERARQPEAGTFIHQSKFEVHWLSSVGGGWERRPTPEELTTQRWCTTRKMSRRRSTCETPRCVCITCGMSRWSASRATTRNATP